MQGTVTEFYCYSDWDLLFCWVLCVFVNWIGVWELFLELCSDNNGSYILPHLCEVGYKKQRMS